MFQVGDVVIHLHRGAGKVVDIERLQCLGSDKRYYALQLFDVSETHVWVSIQDAENGELRRPVSQSKLRQVWRVLRAMPKDLPADHNKRYEIVGNKLHTGNVLQVAEALRDLSWKNEYVRSLTLEGKRLYQRGMDFLSGEVAVVEQSSLESAKAKVAQVLKQSVSAQAPV